VVDLVVQAVKVAPPVDVDGAVLVAAEEVEEEADDPQH